VPVVGEPGPASWGEAPRSARGAGLPKAGLPKAGLPKAGLPKAGLPKAGLPKAGLPKAGLPKVGLPKVGLKARTKHDRAQKAVRGGTGTVMHGVAGGNPAQPASLGKGPAVGEAPVGTNVVYEEVCQPVRRHAGPGCHQPGPPAETTRSRSAKRKAREEDGEPVVPL
jgi:hypothetical protein